MNALDRLAALAGIEPCYYDVWGNLNQVGDDVKRALLAAMGFSVASEAEVEMSMQAQEQRSWRRPLEPITVVGAEQQPGTVAITLPVDPTGAILNWKLTEETGKVHENRVIMGDLPVIAIYTIDNRLIERRGLRLPKQLPCGYHRLAIVIEYADTSLLDGETTVVIAPHCCYLPEDITPDANLWGIATQLYSLRTNANWGMGDFGDLLYLIERSAANGAAAIGLNPLHALFPAHPSHISPYSPSSRSFLNTLYIDITAVPEFADCKAAQSQVNHPSFQARLNQLREAEFVDYQEVAAHKNKILLLLFDCFQRLHLATQSPRGSAFVQFCQEQGTTLERLALFDALHEHFLKRNPHCWTWRNWPIDYQHPDSPPVAAFATQHQDRVNYFKYLQWLANEQLAAVAHRACELGMPIGLYMDLAVGVDPAGGEAWSDQESLVSQASLGAPPDPLNQLGQNWGLIPLNPVALRERAYMPFIGALRASMRYAGALRIDHVMSLLRLFWIPSGSPPTAGVYVRYPLEEMVRILALESQRQRCIVIGEDLGTVPEGFRDIMAAAGILSYRVLYFERWPDGLFKRPNTYPEHSLATVSTHDLPTLAGWWLGRDIDWRANLGLHPNDRMKSEDIASRPIDRERLLNALLDAKVIAPEALPPRDPPGVTTELLAAVHRMLARSRARIMMVQLEDLLGQEEQANLPGTVNEHPNWRRKLALNLEALFENSRAQTIFKVLREERPAPPLARPLSANPG
jgi:4-alpha-glucanotransferase